MSLSGMRHGYPRRDDLFALVRDGALATLPVLAGASTPNKGVPTTHNIDERPAAANAAPEGRFNAAGGREGPAVCAEQYMWCVSEPAFDRVVDPYDDILRRFSHSGNQPGASGLADLASKTR